MPSSLAFPPALRTRTAVFLAAGLLVMAAQTPEAVPSTGVVISQVYGGGNNTGAPYRNDFVELFNRGTAPVLLTGMSIQYASATGTGNFGGNPVTALTGTLAPGQYYLVQLAGGTTNGVPLPAADAVGTANMSGTGGKVALVNSGAGLACNGSIAQPCSPAQLAQIVDLVGWDGANFFETAAAPATTNATAILRKSNGCTESDDNSQDFLSAPPAPRNTASTLAPCVADTPPTVSSTTPAAGAGGVALAADLSVTFSEPVTVGSGTFALVCGATSYPLTVAGGPTTYTLSHETALQSATNCTLTIQAAGAVDVDVPLQPMTADVLVPFPTIDSCGDPATKIHTIQGSGPVSLIPGTVHTIEGIVTGDYQGAGQFGGYFVQEEDADGDGDPATSEVIFVFNPTPVNAGDRVRLRGTVTVCLSSGTPLTELTAVSGVQVCAGAQALPAVSTIELPVASPDAWEAYEGMLVSIPQALTVSDTFTLGRFGEVVLSVNGRLMQPTHVAQPGAAAAALQADNNRRRIVLDDANNQQNIDPTRYPQGGLSASNTLRAGDRLNGLSGILEQRFGVYRIQPIGAVAFDVGNARPAPPVAPGGTLRVASFNVLNYFNGDGVGGGFPTPRGATTLAEFVRQRDKTIAAITAINADILGLMELENDAPPMSALEDLVDGLNAATLPGTYAFIDTGVVGTDEIRVGLLYKPAVVTPFNSYALLTSAVNPLFLDTLNRPSLAQTFTRNSNGKRLTVVVNHLKSKGSDCNDAGDPDAGDGQGNCNATRTKATTALAQWLATDPTGSGDPDIVIVGDMNAYAKEDPITTLTSAGYVDVIAEQIGAGAYSYVFQGQSGYLDHGLASSRLVPRVATVTEWHVNADEPVALDYNVEFKTPAQVNPAGDHTFYAPDAFRSSDHDPVVLDINLIEPFAWSGFYSPVSEWSTANAGSAVPIKFSLGGNRGLDIFAPGSPASTPVPCEGVVASAAEPAGTAGSSGLQYDPLTDRYTYVWKTQKSWSGTCRQLIVTLADGTVHTAMFRFTK